MAKLHPQIADALQAGFASSGTDATCPHYATSPCGEAWIFGRYMGDSGRTIEGVEKGRGSVYRKASGSSFRVVHSRDGTSVERVA